jgi:hypothetical protein
MEFIHVFQGLIVMCELIFVVTLDKVNHIVWISKGQSHILHDLLDCGFEVVVDAGDASRSNFYLNLFLDILFEDEGPSLSPILLGEPIFGEYSFEVLLAFLSLVLVS